MKYIAKFEKISKKQAEVDGLAEFYDNLILPKRATVGSAGYDFSMPYNVSLKPGESIRIATGIRCMIKDGYVLKIYIRSSLGFKYGLQLANTVGIIDSDYYNADNEGHIQVKIINAGDIDVNLKAGDKFAQGVFERYYLAEEEKVENRRRGGIGSTTK